MLEKVTEREATLMAKAIKWAEKQPEQHLAHTVAQMRRWEEQLGLSFKTVVPRKFWNVALRFAEWLYDLEDLGRFGKHAEAKKRLSLNEGSWVYWREFFAHGHGEQDIKAGKNHPGFEMKTGAGDFLTSVKADTWEQLIELYKADHTLVCWEVKGVDKSHGRHAGEEFRFSIFCTWAELFGYLEQYNGDITTWLRTDRLATDGKAVGAFQEFSTSHKKIVWLVNCPWNEWR